MLNMSKGLESLENIKLNHNRIGNEKDFDIIEKELKELEERREMMRRFNEACVPMILDNETEKKLKALEIIKKYFIYNFDEFTAIDEWYDEYFEQEELLKEIINE